MYTALTPLIGIAAACGLNIYLTVLIIGAGLRFQLFAPPPALASLSALGNDYVLIAAAVLYLLEFVADKVPWFDSIWDTVHTVIRPLGAAVIGATAASGYGPGVEAAVFLLSGGVALSTHSTKAGVRLTANASPEPISNIVLSLLEDVVVVGVTWLALSHPVVAAAIVIVFLVVFIFLARTIYRLIKGRMEKSAAR